MVLSYSNTLNLLSLYKNADFHHAHYPQLVIARSIFKTKGDILEFERPSKINYATVRLSDTAEILNMITPGC
jgi:hypothetical protein